MPITINSYACTDSTIIAAYNTAFDYDLYAALIASFDMYMPLDAAALAQRLLVATCQDRVNHGGAIRRSAEIELRQLILTHLVGYEGNTARYALDTYLARFTK